MRKHSFADARKAKPSQPSASAQRAQHSSLCRAASFRIRTPAKSVSRSSTSKAGQVSPGVGVEAGSVGTSVEGVEVEGCGAAGAGVEGAAVEGAGVDGTGVEGVAGAGVAGAGVEGAGVDGDGVGDGVGAGVGAKVVGPPHW